MNQFACMGMCMCVCVCLYIYIYDYIHIYIYICCVWRYILFVINLRANNTVFFVIASIMCRLNSFTHVSPVELWFERFDIKQMEVLSNGCCVLLLCQVLSSKMPYPWCILFAVVQGSKSLQTPFRSSWGLIAIEGDEKNEDHILHHVGYDTFMLRDLSEVVDLYIHIMDMDSSGHSAM